MEKLDRLFFELLHVAIGSSQSLSSYADENEWKNLYAVFKKQAMLGVGYCGIMKLPKDQVPPIRVLAQWAHDAERIKTKNQALNAGCSKVSNWFGKSGFRVTILKGQSNLVNYPDDLFYYRTSGDIDLFALPVSEARLSEDTAAVKAKHGHLDAKPVISFVKRLCKSNGINCPQIRYHHIDFPLSKIPVELHFRYSYFNCPWHNHAFQKWCYEHRNDIVKTSVDQCEFLIPTAMFNAVYQLVHIYRHLFCEGIGLRQILDYYYVLKNVGAGDKENVYNTLCEFGMKRFAGAIMWILQEIFAMPKEQLICEPNEIAGRFVLDEVMMAGNFGKYDERNKNMKDASKAKRFFLLTQRNWRFLTQYPTEVVFDPWRRIEVWRMNKILK